MSSYANPNVIFIIVICLIIASAILIIINLIIHGVVGSKENFKITHSLHPEHMNNHNSLSILNKHISNDFFEKNDYGFMIPIRYKNSKGININHNNLNFILFPVNPAIQICGINSEHGCHLYYSNFKDHSIKSRLHQTDLGIGITNENKYHVYMQTQDIRQNEPLPRKWRGIIQMYCSFHNTIIKDKFSSEEKYYIIVETDIGKFNKYPLSDHTGILHISLNSPKYIKFYLGDKSGKFLGMFGIVKIHQTKLFHAKLLDEFSVIPPQFETFKFVPHKSTPEYALWQNKTRDVLLKVYSKTLSGPTFNFGNNHAHNPQWNNTNNHKILELTCELKSNTKHKDADLNIWT
jgi:hypothetical protein